MIMSVSCCLSLPCMRHYDWACQRTGSAILTRTQAQSSKPVVFMRMNCL